MEKILFFLAIGVGIYWTVWTIIYIWIMGFNFKYYWDYFWASWWEPGEIPGIIWFYSFFITLFILLIMFIASFSFRKFARR